MNTDTKKISDVIKEQFAKLPKEVQLAVTDTNLIQKTKDIALKYALHIDQLGSLQNEIIFVMVGLEPSIAFVDNISDELSIDTQKANNIAKDVNESIFDPIRTYLRKWEENGGIDEDNTKNVNAEAYNTSVSDLERAGGFSIESGQGEEHGNGQNAVNMSETAQPLESHEMIIEHIENPQSIPTSMSTSTTSTMSTEPLIDHLLNAPMVNVVQKSSIAPASTSSRPASVPVPPPVAPKPSGPDLYREPIE